jgi:NADH:ubiquinone oxidoreductase subunit E
MIACPFSSQEIACRLYAAKSPCMMLNQTLIERLCPERGSSFGGEGYAYV